MDWTDNLQEASFRGVPFQVQSTRTGYGRRNVVHEFPGRDVPFAEDLGRRARSFKITGYVLGDDALQSSAALIEACEAEGPGKLVHPAHGEISVVCNRCDVTDSWSEGRMFRFSLDFSEAGEVVEPAARVDTSASLLAEVDQARVELIESFELLLDVIGLPDYLLGEITSVVASIAAAIEGLRPRALLPDYAASLDRLLAALGVGGDELLLNGTAVRTVFASVEALGDAVAPELAAERLPALLDIVPPVPSSDRTSGPLAALVGTIQAAGLLEIAATSAVLTYPSQGAAHAHRDQVRDLFDIGIAAAAERFDDVAFDALQRVASAAVRDITERGASLAPMMPWQVERSMPALVGAWRLYSDPDRDGEIVEQLGANHPLFLPTDGRVVSQ